MNPKIKKALKLHQAGQIIPARMAYEKILRADPANPDALHFYGVLLNAEGHTEKAVRLIEKAIEIDPGYLAAWQNLGNVFLGCGHVESAENCYRRVVETQPENSGAWSNLCIILKKQGELREARDAGTRATALDPGNKLSWYSLANALKAEGLVEDAIISYQKVIDLDPGFTLAHQALCNATYLIETNQGLKGMEMRRTRSAFKNWRNSDPDGPVSRYMLSAFNEEETPERAPDDYVVDLFDKFSDSFDHNLNNLGYRVPALMLQKVKDLYTQPEGQLELLDAGCGTGLLGAGLRPWASRLVGVDLSPGMLSKARKRRLYDELFEAELGDWLENCDARFDLVICADTIVYFGELDYVLRGMHRVMNPGATLLFTVECCPDNGRSYVLNPSGRFSHGRDYICRSLAEAGLTLLETGQAVLRKEAGQDVDGLLVSAKKTTDFIRRQSTAL